MQITREKIILIFLILFGLMNLAHAKEISIKNKIAQMLMLGFNGTELQQDNFIVKAIQSQQVGGVILFDYDLQSKKFTRNIKSPQQLKELTQQLQKYATEAAYYNKNKLVPLLIAIDYEGGKVNRLKESNGFPKTFSAMQVGKSTTAKANDYANSMAKTLRIEGINTNFAPVVDLNINSNNPIIGALGRSFSIHPKKVIQYAKIFSKAYYKQGILCAYKHFPGHGSSEGDSHTGLVEVTQTWRPLELQPYQVLFKQPYSCPIVVTAHIIQLGLDKKGYPASLSKAITTGLLRHTLHFNGVVVTDDLQMKAITDKYTLAESVRLAINAGADILVFGNQLQTSTQWPQPIINLIYEDVKTGKISKARIEEAYQRIMALKNRLKKPLL